MCYFSQINVAPEIAEVLALRWSLQLTISYRMERIEAKPDFQVF